MHRVYLSFIEMLFVFREIWVKYNAPRFFLNLNIIAIVMDSRAVMALAEVRLAQVWLIDSERPGLMLAVGSIYITGKQTNK